MKNKFYKKQKNRKSFASIFLAILLTLSFNSSPLLAVSNYMSKNANAYKSEQKYVYYPTTSTTSSDKFTQYIPSALTNYVVSNGTNFNLLEYYNSKFTPLFTEWADKFFWENPDSAYRTQVRDFLDEFDRVSVSDFYEVNKDDYENCKSIRDFVEYFAMNEMKNTNTGTTVQKLCDTKSDFYQKFFNFVSGELTGNTEDFSGGDGVDSGATAEQFYEQSKSYKLLKELFDSEIAKNVAIVSHDGETQNVNVAALIAESVPTFIDYNYTSKSYTSYVTITDNAKHVQHTPNEMESKDAIYYFGYRTNIVNTETYKKYGKYFQETSGKDNVDILYYYPTNSSHFGYIDQDHTTYYKYTSMPYAQSNSKYLVYILNNNPTVAEKDTYESLYYNVISQKDLDEDTNGLYVQLPYENDKLYFKAIYNNSLYNTKYDFDTFCDMFAPGGNSIIYLKLSSSSNYKVFIDESKLDAFKKEYPTFPYVTEGVEINKYDYTKIESTSNYYRKNYDLYFENTKEYFVDSAISYSGYETVDSTAYELEQKEVPSSQYDGNVYAVKLTDGLDDISGVTTIEQTEVDTKSKFYIAAPDYHYETLNVSKENYALYYKHTSTQETAIFVVDDSVDEKESEIYQTLNYSVITTSDIKTYNKNYIAVAEDDDNFTKSFSLYYKYVRNTIKSQVYVLDDTDNIDESIMTDYTNKGYKVIKTADLVDYTPVLESDTADYDANYKLYYRLADVFVQNLITNSTAIYIVDDNISNTDKSTYGMKSYTPITSNELKVNASFYKLIESKDPNYNESFTKLYYKYNAAAVAKKVVYTIDQIDTNAEGFDFNNYELIKSGEDYEEGVEKYYKKLSTTTDYYESNKSYYYFKSPEITLVANSYYAISFYVNTTKDVEASVYLKDTSGVMKDIAIEKINTDGEWKQYYMFISTDSVSASKANIYLYLGDQNSVAGSKFTDVTYTALEPSQNVVYDEHKVYYVHNNSLDKKVVYTFDENDWNESEDEVKYSQLFSGSIYDSSKIYYTYNSSSETYEIYNKLTNSNDWETQTVNTISKVEEGQIYNSSLDYYTDSAATNSYTFNLNDWEQEAEAGSDCVYKLKAGIDLFCKTTSQYEILKGNTYGPVSKNIQLDVNEEYYTYNETTKVYSAYTFNINDWDLSNETLLTTGAIYDENTFYFYNNGGVYTQYEFNVADWTLSGDDYTLNSGVSLYTATFTLKDNVTLYIVTYSPNTIYSKTVLTTKFIYNGTTPIYVRNNPTWTGSALFNELKITNIGVTDYNKMAIDDKPVESTNLTEEVPGQDEPVPVDGKYADEYNNELIVVNKVTAYKDVNQFDYKTTIENEFANWNNMFDFEDDTLQSKLSTEKLGKIDSTTDGYSMYEDTFVDLWRYYISRDSKIEYTIEQFRHAYNNGDLDVSITNVIEKTKADNEDDEDRYKVISLDGETFDLTTESGKSSLKETLEGIIDNKNDISLSGDVFTIEDITYDVTKAEDRTKLNTKVQEFAKDKAYVESPFEKDNYALKLENKNTNTALGITSNAFTVKRMDYLKITVWIYSPDKDGSATIAVNSVQKRQNEDLYGKLLTSSIDVDANVSKYTNTVINEYGWMPVYLYIEGSALKDQDCYLVLTAGKDCTVYFDNITIERVTSANYDTVNSDSDSKTCALSLSPTDSLISTGVTNGNFDLINVTTRDVPNANDLKIAESWTVESGSSKNVQAGVMSLTNKAYFDNFPVNVPVDGINTYGNIYVVDAESSVKAITGEQINNYKNTYKFYSASISLSANSVYKLTFDFYAHSSFNGTLVSSLYSNSKLGDENRISKMYLDSSEITKNQWNTYTYYIATSTSSTSVYLELGIEYAYGLGFFKYVASTKESTKTFDELKADVYKNAGITDSNTEDIYNSIKDARFVNYADPQFSFHSDSKANDEAIYSQKEYTHSLATTNKYTVGTNGAAVATFYETNTTKTHSVTIDKTTYYIGEVYEVVYDTTTYYVHRTINNNTNKYVYKMYSDTELTTEVTKLGEHDITIVASGEGVKVTANEVDYNSTKTSYRLFTFSDCTVEVTSIGGKDVKVESLNKVVVGTETDNDSYTSTKKENNSYVYSFKNEDYIINNVIIPGAELKNAQSENVLILANSYSTDYQTLEPLYKKSLSKSAYYSLRIYVKTSDFASDDFGLNINISTLGIKWTNVNTTEATNADEYGFVCYEVLIKTNNADAVSNVGVTLSLGDTSDATTHTGAGYAIISGIELVNYSTEAEFNHYAETAELNETTQKKYYDNPASSTSDSKDDEKDADDETTVSWATFFYIFSSLLLVLVIAIAMIAVILKKHPIKFAKKYENDHNKDIEIIKVKKSKGKSADELDAEKDKKNDGIL